MLHRVHAAVKVGGTSPSALGPWRGRGTNIARRLQLSHCSASPSPCDIHRISQLAPKLCVGCVIGRGAFVEFEYCSVRPDHPDPVCSRVLVGKKVSKSLLLRRPRISPELAKGALYSRTVTDKARRNSSAGYCVFPDPILSIRPTPW